MASTPESSSKKPNCTAVADRFHADAFAVCRQGSIVALHVYTRQGEIIVTVAEGEFLREARGATDHNGNPWRELLDPKQRDEVLQADVAQISAEKSQRQPSQFTPEVEQKFFAIEKKKLAGSPLSFRILCDEAGVSSAAFYSWRVRTGRALARAEPLEASV